MFTKESLTDLTRNLMDFHGLHDWKIRIGSAKNIAGMCNYTRKQITMSLFLANARSRENTVDTILHEIAHALTPKDGGHGKEWKAMASAIGADPSRCFDSAEIDPAKRFRFHGHCPAHPSRVFKRNRRTSANCFYCPTEIHWVDVQDPNSKPEPFTPPHIAKLAVAIEKFSADFTDDGVILPPIGHVWTATETHYLDPTLSYYTESDSGRQRTPSGVLRYILQDLEQGITKCNCQDCRES